MATKNRVVAHHEPNPDHFVLTKSDFAQLTDKARIPEKENTLFLVGLLIPSLINIASTWPKENEVVGPIFTLNMLVVIVSLIGVFFQGREWKTKRCQFSALIKTFEERPKIDMEYSTAKGYMRADDFGAPADGGG
jgi:hypothetical protein